MAGKVTAVDPGSHTFKVLSLKDTRHGLALLHFAAFPAAEGSAGLGASGAPLKDVVAGLAGRDMTLRYTQVPPSPDWQLQNLMDLEIQDMAGQAGGGLSADYNLLPIEDEEGGMETVLLAFARDEALDRVASQVEAAGGRVAAHVPNCIALYNAFLRCGPVEEDVTVGLVNLGHETTDIAIVRGVDLLFVRNLSNGGKVFDDAIAAAFNVSDRKAQSLKKELLDLDPQSRGRYASGQAEKVTMAAGGAGSMIVSAVQSSIAFCKSQTRIPGLQLDKVLICGGSARVRGVKGMLREALRCPVEEFDPFQSVDIKALPESDRLQLDGLRSEAVIALGLAATHADPSLYRLEILPEAVKRRRQFFGRTIYNIGAALCLLAVLIAVGSTEQKRVEAAELAHRQVSRQKSQLTGVHNDTEKLRAVNEATRDLVGYLAERAVPLNGIVLTGRALQQCMPPEFWITSAEVKNQAMGAGARGRSAGAKPLIVLKGAGKDVSGRGVTEAYSSFLAAFKQLEFDGVRPEVQPVGDGREFTWVIDFRPDADPDTTPR